MWWYVTSMSLTTVGFRFYSCDTNRRARRTLSEELNMLDTENVRKCAFSFVVPLLFLTRSWLMTASE
jgi:hypothetical protein